MACSFCNKSASKQYYLCDCCLVNLERCNATAKNLFHAQEKPVPVIKSEEDAGVRKIEIDDSSLGTFQEDELLQHREMCTTRLVFRCAICHQDYMSKEGMWNHLDLHEVADENKQMECTEVQVAHSLLKCVLCNDQRGYQERLYWQHVHEDHDGFFLQCSECGDGFRSQKLLTDHVLNHCNAREQAVLSISNDTITDQKHLDSQFIESSHDGSNPSHMEDDDKGEQDLNKLLINATGEISQPLVEKTSSGSTATKCPHCGKECFDKTLLADHIKYRHSPTECDICGIILTSINQARYHKLKHHTEQKHKCPHCSMKFHAKTEYQRHLSKHLKDRKFPKEKRQAHHTAYILPDLEGSSERDEHQEQGSDMNLLQDEYEFVAIKEEISVEEPMLQEQDYNVDDTDASSSTIINCPICGGIFGTKDENHLAVHVEMIHQLFICTICGIMMPTADQLKVHEDHQHSALSFNRDFNSQSVSNTEPIETINPISSHYSTSFFASPKPAAATVQELNPSYLADEDVSNCSSSDGWEVYSTISVNEIESYVLSVEFGFRFKTQNIPSKGKMRYYQCRRIKVRCVPQCERKLLVFIPSNQANPDADATVSLKGKHSCLQAPTEILTHAGLILHEMESNSFDGWEVHSTIPVHEIETYVLSIEFGFRFKTQNAPSKGKMRYYNCRRIKIRVLPQCERKLLVFIPNNQANTDADATISLKGKHTCVNAPPALLARAKLNEMDCDLITNLVQSGVPSKDVRKHFREVNSEVSDNQLRHALHSALKTVRK